MKSGLSEAQILERAKYGFYVRRYAWSQANLRKKCRRMAKDGKLVVEWRDKGGFFYRTAP